MSQTASDIIIYKSPDGLYQLSVQELMPEATVRKFRTVQKEGAREVARNLDHYNIDMIIAKNFLKEKELKVLNNLAYAGKVSRFEAQQKATAEYKKYKAKTLSSVEKNI